MFDNDSFAERLRIDARDKHQLGSSAGVLLTGAVALLVGVVAIGAVRLAWNPQGAAQLAGLTAAAPADRAAPAVAPPTPPPAPASFEATGYVVATRSASVAPEVGGMILESPFSEGDQIKAGQVIARLSSQAAQDQVALRESELASEIAALEEIRADLHNAQSQLARSEALVANRDVSQVTLDNDRLSVARQIAKSQYQNARVEVARRNLQVARNNLDLYTVHAPISGVLSKKTSQVGEYVSPASYTNTALGTIVDRSSIVAEITVSETNLGRVALGQRVRVTLNGYPDVSFGGQVSSIAPEADRPSGTVKIDVTFDRLDDRMRPETGVRAAFLLR